MPSVPGFTRNLYVSGRIKETTFGSDTAAGLAVADFQMFRTASDPFQFAVDLQDDLDVTGGLEGVTDSEVLAQRLDGPYSQPRVKPHTLAAFAGFAMGSVTSSTDGNGRKHTFTPVESYNAEGLSLPSFTAVEDCLAYQKWHTGIVVDSFTLETNRKGYLDFSATFLGSGKRYTWTTDMSAASEVASEPWLKAGNAKVWMHRGSRTGTYDGSIAQSKTADDLTGYPEDVSGRILSFRWTYQNNPNADDLYRFNSGVTMAAGERVRRAQALQLSFEVESFDSVEDLGFVAHLDGDLLGTLSDGSDIPATSSIVGGSYSDRTYGQALLVTSSDSVNWKYTGGAGEGTYLVHLYPNFEYDTVQSDRVIFEHYRGANDYLRFFYSVSSDDCLQTDGNGYVSVADTEDLDVGFSDILAECWIKIDDASSASRLVSKIDTAGYELLVSATTARLRGNVGDADGSTISTADGASLDDGAWHHCAILYDRDGNMTRYVDGTLYGTADDISARSGDAGNAAVFAVAASSGGGNLFQGSIDEVRVWNLGTKGLAQISDVALAVSDHAHDRHGVSHRLTAWDDADRTDQVTGDEQTFEAGVGDWTAYSTNTISASTDYAHGGSQSMKITDNEGVVGPCSLSTGDWSGSLTDAVWYEAEAWVYVESANWTGDDVGIYWDNFSGATTTTNTTATQDAWARVSALILCDGDTTGHLKVRANGASGDGSFFYIDDIRVRRVGLVGRWRMDGDSADDTTNGNDLSAQGSGNAFQPLLRWIFRKQADGVNYDAISDVQSFATDASKTFVLTYGQNGVRLYDNGTLADNYSLNSDGLGNAPNTLYLHDQAGSLHPDAHIDEVFGFFDEKSATDALLLSNTISNLGADPLLRLQQQTRGGLELECFGTGNAIAAGSTYYGAGVIFPDLQYKSVNVASDLGGKKTVNVEAVVIEDSDAAAYASSYLTVWNNVFSYLG